MDVYTQVVEDDLVAARQADRSLGSQDFSRLETVLCFYISILFHPLNVALNFKIIL